MNVLSVPLLAIALSLSADPSEAAEKSDGLVVRGVRVQVRLIDEAGQRRAVDANQIFRTGQRFDLTVEPLEAEGWVYVLTEGPTGNRSILFPDKSAESARTRPGNMVQVPPGGDWFRFRPPAGTERLIVIVSPLELDWMTPQALWQLDGGERLAPGDERVAESQRAERNKSIDAIRRRQSELPVYRGTLEEYRRQAARPGTKDVILVPPAGNGDSQELLVVSDAADATSRPPIVVNLQLKHKGGS